MTEYKLYYFDVRNLAEPIRVMLHYNGAEFEDIRVDMEKWPSMKAEMPQSTMPVLEVNGKKLAQSHSIMRYLGRVYNMTGRNNIERAVVDSIADLLKDFYTQVSPFYYMKLGFKDGDLEAARESNLNPAIETKLPLFSRYLKEAHSGFYAKSGITYADFLCSELFDTLHKLEPDIFESHPDIVAHIRRIHSLPQLKSYISKRK